MVDWDQSINKVLDLMKKGSLNEQKAMKKLINMGIRDYVAELYEDGEVTVREAADILQLNFRQTLEILEEKVGGNVGQKEEENALNRARKLAEKS